MNPASQAGMALPYPYEVEIGKLKARPHQTRAPLDIAQLVHDAITASGSTVVLFGVRRELAAPEEAAMLVNRFRGALAQHFLERQSAPDAETWSSFVQQARAQLEHSDQVDDGTLTTLLMTVDGL
jgi:cell fate (sporulation/competence/biofilm development) regulator YlbF (YheA/YmcA/DUF963 family)